jgi:hypothetical protein
MAEWYLRALGLIPTDVQVLADGSPSLAFCRLDLRDQPADHHTLVIVGGIEEKVEHCAYEVLDLDALGQGQQVLRAQGHPHMWGIGRHLLGSQLFDYWFDPDGFEYEHYTDGDVFTADVETAYSALEFGGIWAWGADAPASMKPKKNLRTLLQVLKLIRRKAITPQRSTAGAPDAPARPWPNPPHHATPSYHHISRRRAPGESSSAGHAAGPAPGTGLLVPRITSGSAVEPAQLPPRPPAR